MNQSTLAAPAAATEAVPPLPSKQRDVFISYSHVNRQWVDGLMVDLERSGLTVYIDHRDFELGVSLLENIERAIDRCRHTVLVISNSWLQSEWAKFESLILGTDDPANRRRRLIPLWLERCEVPRRLKIWAAADFTDPARRQAEMSRLLRDLDPEREFPLVNEHVADFAHDGFVALQHLLRDPRVLPLAVEFKVFLRMTMEDIRLLGWYKKQHDLLHDLQMNCYNLLCGECRRLEKQPAANSTASLDDEVCESLQQQQETLSRIADALRRVVAEMPGTGGDWIKRLHDAGERLQAAVQQLTLRPLQQAIRAIDRVLAYKPSEVNTLLCTTATRLRLNDLLKAMEGFCSNLKAGGLPHDLDRLEQFSDGLEAMRGLDVALRTLSREHDNWQQHDGELRRVAGFLDRDLDELDLSWPSLKKQCEELCQSRAESWAEVLRSDASQLNIELESGDPGKIRRAFRAYYRHAGQHFYRVDVDLKELLCEQLPKVGAPLAKVLEMI